MTNSGFSLISDPKELTADIIPAANMSVCCRYTPMGVRTARVAWNTLERKVLLHPISQQRFIEHPCELGRARQSTRVFLDYWQCTSSPMTHSENAVNRP